MALNGLMAKEVKEVCVTENLHALVIHFLLHACLHFARFMSCVLHISHTYNVCCIEPRVYSC